MKQTEKVKTSLSSLISMVCVLLFAGLFGLLIFHSNHAAQQIIEHLKIVVLLEKDIKPETISALQTNLESSENIIPESVEFISAEQAGNTISQEYGDEVILKGDNNVFQPMLTFSIYANAYKDGYIDDLKQSLLERLEVQDVYYLEDVQQSITSNLRTLSIVPLVISILVLIFSVMLIYLTISVQLKRDEQKIKTMQLVGAAPHFIKKPYFNWSRSLSFKSILISIGLLLLSLAVLTAVTPSLAEYVNLYGIALSIAIIVLLGVLIPWITTRFTLNRLMKG